MRKIRSINKHIVERLVQETLDLGQGRGAAAIGFTDRQGRINSATESVSGGVSGLPLRRLIGLVAEFTGCPLLTGINQLPANAVILTTNPGRTGLITDTGSIDLFDLPQVNIGVRNEGFAGAGLLYPRPALFDLATRSEEMELGILDAKTMKEEKEILRANAKLDLEYLRVGRELALGEGPEEKAIFNKVSDGRTGSPQPVRSLSRELAAELVELSVRLGQGREVAAIGVVDEAGRVTKLGKPVVGGDGYVPARLLASSSTDIGGKSQRAIYTHQIPANAVIVHTHPGGTGVMHSGDAEAGPATWGRAIIAIGHDRGGRTKGATVIEASSACMDLMDEGERLDEAFFAAETSADETEIRNRQFGIAQEFTNLCREIPIE